MLIIKLQLYRNALYFLTNQIVCVFIIVKMNTNVVDIIIFGATGFSGKIVVEECAKRNSFTWAIAGRNMRKMEELLQKVALKTGISVIKIPIIEADTNDEQSLKEMVRNGKVVVNCTGPYRFHGEAVVKACVEHGNSYVDISGEPEFMEKMQLLYSDMARYKNSYIVSSCGMDSVPVDLGVMHFIDNFNGQVNYVESYMQLRSNSDKYKPIIYETTWESAVHGFGNIKFLVETRRKLFAKSKKIKPQPSIPARGTVHKSEIFENKYCIPFPGSDRSVVARSQSFFFNEWGKRPVQCNVYLVCDSFTILVAILIVGFFLQILTKFEWSKKLLLTYPQIFSLGMASHEGPSEEIQAASRATLKFYGQGWSNDILDKYVTPSTITEDTNVEMITTVDIENPAYGFTSKCAIECARIIIEEPEKLPSKGGVYTPGYAFFKTSIFKRLAKHGIEYKRINLKIK